MKKQLFIVFALLFGATGVAHAQSQTQQEPYAKIIEVDGLVTVTSNNQLSNAVKNMPLIQGGQILTTSSGSATVEFSNGCRVSLKPSQSLEIEEVACKIFLASSSGAASLTGTAGAAAFSTTSVLLLGLGGVAALAAATSGNGTAATTGTDDTEIPVTVIPEPVVAPTSGA